MYDKDEEEQKTLTPENIELKLNFEHKFDESAADDN